MKNAGPEQSPEAWRLFIAIELPQDLRQKIKAHGDQLRKALPDVRASWTREQNLHLTLKFLGDVQVTQLESVSQALLCAARRSNQFELVIRNCGSFPARGKPNVLWIGIENPSGNLNSLQQAVEEECARVGFVPEKRPFHPHLTLARLRQPRGARQLADLHEQAGFAQVTTTVRDVCLIRSELSSSGSRYTVLSRHELTL